MLRYNNSGTATKPVDYYRPLTVDVSVEYELPKEVAPPKGSAPLLIIHPSAYFRSKNSIAQSPDKPTITTSHRPSPNHNSRLGDIASTLYYLSTSNGLPPNASSQASSLHPHINKPTHRPSHPTEFNRNTRSRTTKGDQAAQHTRCDGLGNGALSSIHQSQQSFVEHGRNGAKKAHHLNHPIPTNVVQVETQSYGVPSTYAYSRTQVQLLAPASNQLVSNARTTANNKRLRMMSQQQPIQTQLHPNPTQAGLMEPLNLALTSSATGAAYNHQFSTFLGLNAQSGRSPSANQNHSYAYPLGQTKPLSALAQQSFIRGSWTGFGSKDVAVPVEKGSGSDSGVCSENDSDDVSPPMPPFPTGQVARRANASGGCYCCCCPGGGNSSRKVSKSSWKGHAEGMPSSGGLGNYENLLNLIHQHQQTLLGDGAGEPPSIDSRMDSSGNILHPSHQRKWFPQSILQEHAFGNTQAPFGKWYQNQV